MFQLFLLIYKLILKKNNRKKMSSSNKIIPPLLSEQSYNLSKLNYLSKNIILVSHIPESLFSKDILYQKKFLGQYGHINQMILLKQYKNERNVIVQFDTVNQAALAILSLQNFKIDENSKLKANYFITKYCYYFLNQKNCPNPNCLFLHENKINNYLLLEIKNNKQIDSYKFALDVLNLSKPVFDVIYMKLIGDNFYERQKKFPKMTMKKLKNEEFINSLYPLIRENLKNKKNNNYKKRPQKIKNDNIYNKDNNINNKRNNKKKNSKRDSFNSIDSNNEKISTSEESIEKNYESNNNTLIFKRKNISRFDFVKNNNNDNEVIVPEFILDFIDKYLVLHCNEIKFNDNNENEIGVFFNDFNNWFSIIEKFNFITNN